MDFSLGMETKFHIVQYAFIAFAILCLMLAVYHYFKGKPFGFILKACLLFAALGAIALLDMYLIEPAWIATERVVIHDPELARVLEGVKVVQISDLHLDGASYRQEQLVDKVNALKPDILFITGDFFTNNTRGESALQEFGEISGLIRRFKASVGIFGCLGNYDNFLMSYPERVDELRNAGIDILYNENRKILLPNKKVLWLAGSYYDSEHDYSRSKFMYTLVGIPPRAPVILLNHYPDVFGTVFNADVNLVLAGHTHGGQIGLPFLVHMSKTANKSNFISGLFETGKAKMYVNRGIGTTNLPVRFLCRPEITVFEFVDKPVI